MQISKRKILLAKRYIENPDELDNMKKYMLYDLLKNFGIWVDLDSCISREMMVDMCKMIFKDILEKNSGVNY